MPAFQAIGSVVHVSILINIALDIIINSVIIIKIDVILIITISGIWFNIHDAGIIFPCRAFIISG